MKKTFVIIAAVLFLGAFVAPSFASVDANYSVMVVDDEPAKKDDQTADKKSSDCKAGEKKSECTKSTAEKSACTKTSAEKASCDKEKSASAQK